MLRRDRILDQLDRHPTTGVIAWIVGPIGSGKSTIAVQWASALGKPVQYVSAKPHPFSGEIKSEPSDEFGKALEDLLNACGDTSKAPSVEEISACLKIVVELSKSEPRVFILDDMEMIRRSAMLILQELLIEALPELKVDRALVISRTIDSNVLSGLQALRSLRMILPPTLAFDRDEAAEAQRIGVFGTATPEQVENARVNSEGWITGMLSELHGHGGRTIDVSELRGDVLNNLLLHQPPVILRVMMASAHLPFNHHGIWERWFDSMELPHWIIPSTMSQIPTVNDSKQPGVFDVAPPCGRALRELRSITITEQSLQELFALAIDWYVENDHLDAATSLATEQGFEERLLDKLFPVCSELAQKEQWAEISELLMEIPVDLIKQNSDLAFWQLHGLVETGQWAEMKKRFDQIQRTWIQSTDPLTVGRSHLVRAWNAYMLNRGEEAFLASKAAHDTLPETAHLERYWAAGTASISQFLRGYPNDARDWSAELNYERGFLSDSSQWWHHNAGPLRYSWFAITGMMEKAHELTSLQVRRLNGSDVPDRARYLMLLAQIETEKLEFESADAYLSEAKSVMTTRYAQDHHYRMALTNYLRAKGNVEDAASILSAARVPENQRLDQFSRELYARARLALDMGDLDAAELFLSGSPSHELAWPKIFGDAHPAIVTARVDLLRGRVDKAISMAQAVVKEATERGHLYYVVNASAALAHIYHTLGRSELRNRAVATAIAAAGNSDFQLAFTMAGVDVRTLSKFSDDDLEELGIMNADSITVNPVDRLTTREIEVLSLVGGGLSNKQIAENMFISVSTVKNHLASAYDKLGTNNRRGATKIARDLGLIDS